VGAVAVAAVEATGGDGDGQDGLMDGGVAGGGAKELPVAVGCGRVLVVGGLAGEPGPVLDEPGGAGEIGPREGGDRTGGGGKGGQQVAPGRQEPVLFLRGLGDELATGDGDDGGEGAALAVTDRAEVRAGPPGHGEGLETTEGGGQR